MLKSGIVLGMARIARVIAPGVPRPILQRGNCRQQARKLKEKNNSEGCPPESPKESFEFLKLAIDSFFQKVYFPIYIEIFEKQWTAVKGRTLEY